MVLRFAPMLSNGLPELPPAGPDDIFTVPFLLLAATWWWVDRVDLGENLRDEHLVEANAFISLRQSTRFCRVHQPAGQVPLRTAATGDCLRSANLVASRAIHAAVLAVRVRRVARELSGRWRQRRSATRPQMASAAVWPDRPAVRSAWSNRYSGAEMVSCQQRPAVHA
jgi:hypothetical protein